MLSVFVFERNLMYKTKFFLKKNFVENVSIMGNFLFSNETLSNNCGKQCYYFFTAICMEPKRNIRFLKTLNNMKKVVNFCADI